MKAAVVTWVLLKYWKNRQSELEISWCRNCKEYAYQPTPCAVNQFTHVSCLAFPAECAFGTQRAQPRFYGVFSSSQPPSVSEQTLNNLKIAIQDSNSGTISLLYNCPSMVTIQAADADHRALFRMDTYFGKDHISHLHWGMYCSMSWFAPSALLRLFRGISAMNRYHSDGIQSRTWGLETSSRHAQLGVRKSHVIPDFVQIFRRIHLPCSIPPVIEREKVILLIEIKPKRLRTGCLFDSEAANYPASPWCVFGELDAQGVGSNPCVWSYLKFHRPPGITPSDWMIIFQGSHLWRSTQQNPSASAYILEGAEWQRGEILWSDVSSMDIGDSIEIPCGDWPT